MAARIAIALILLAVCVPGVAQEPAAVVVRYQPPRAEHPIMRADGSSGVIGLGTPLFAGDTVTVVEGGRVIVGYADGTEEEHAAGAVFTVPERESLGVMAQIYGRLQAVLGRQYRQGGNLTTRGNSQCSGDARAAAALEVPALHAETRLGPGHEDLSLAWVGGCAPYALEFRRGTTELFRAAGLARPQARLATGLLEPGGYELQIGDAVGQSVAFDVQVVDTLPAGPVPAGVETADPSGAASAAQVGAPGELAAVAYAAWLANHEAGRWRWESFQQLRPWIRRGSALAGTYGDLILWGDPMLEAHGAGD